MSTHGGAAGDSAESFTARRGTMTYRPFNNEAHGLEADFRLTKLADMKG